MKRLIVRSPNNRYLFTLFDAIALLATIALIALFFGGCGSQGYVVVYNNPCSVQSTPTGAEISCPDGSRVPITNGQNGTNGSNGVNGHSALISTLAATTLQCSNGGTVFVMGTDADDNNVLDTNDSNLSTAVVCNGLNAPPTPFTPVGLIDPCGDAPGRYDEVLIKMSDNTILASFSDNANGDNTRFGVLPAGTYTTTDGDGCVFTLDGSGNITSENHHY